MRRRIARQWDDLLAQVRAMDGFESFLTPIPYRYLAAVATDGPVVILNVSRYGCHALIVTSDSHQPGVVNLADMHLDAIVEHANRMLQALAGAAHMEGTFIDRERDRHTILDILGWLWDVLAEPVLTALGHTSAQEG